MDSEKLVEMVVKDRYDSIHGEGAFDEEKRIRIASGLKWLTPSFEMVFSQYRAAVRIVVEECAKVADQLSNDPKDFLARKMAEMIAGEIRSLSPDAKEMNDGQ